MPVFQDELRERLPLVSQQYHPLIILLSSDNSPIDSSIEHIANDLGVGYVNLGLELSQVLLPLTERQRILRLSQWVGQIIENVGEKPVLLNHIEILFEPDRHQDPLRLLQGLSRNRVIIAVWNGQVIHGFLTYAVPDHPEYRKYPIQDLNILAFADYPI